jgi:DNA-binding NarL/FixJ family response regulator
MPDQLQIVLLDDHKVIRDGLKAMLFGHPVYKVVGSVGTVEEFYPLVQEKKPHLCILDIHLAGSNGLDVAKWLKQNEPLIKILIMTALHDVDIVRQCRAFSIDGIISKESGKDTILEALDSLKNDRNFFAGQFTEMLFKTDGSDGTLTDREKDFVRAFARGWSQKEIADYLHISPRTVEVHKKNVMDKLGLHSSVDLVKYAIKAGLASLD